MSPCFRRALLATSALVPLGINLASANPLDPQIAGGSPSIAGQGTAHLTVTQQTDKAIINWRQFDIGAGETTQFVQPSSTSVTLNRVTGGLGASQINGSLTANGRIFLVNPDGILFGSGARIDTGGFLGTTHDIRNEDFMAGRYVFGIAGKPDASIVNEGQITARDGGFAALVAPGLRNSGIITARLGRIALASGNGFTLDFYGDQLITLAVSDGIAATVKDVATGKPLDALIKNEGTLKADGGQVALTASSVRQVVDSVINNTGVIEADSIGSQNGEIILAAATDTTKTADAPTQTVVVSGVIEAAGKDDGTTGGKVKIIGEAISLSDTKIDVSGRVGGGTALIGGDIAGGAGNPAVTHRKAKLEAKPIPNATSVSVDRASVIDASATDQGDGGKVVVWSDGTTNFLGTIYGRGGILSGNGGFTEVSGHQSLGFDGLVDLKAPNGSSGLLLLDPLNAVIGGSGAGAISVSSVENALAAGQVMVTTGTGGGEAGDLTVAQSITWNATTEFILSAYRNVTINSGVTIKATNFGHLGLRADNTGTGVGTVTFLGTGKIDFSGSSGSIRISYNPSNNPAGSGINPTSYTAPTDYSAHVLTSGPGQLFTEMLVNTVFDLQNMRNNLSGSYLLGRNIDASGTASWNGGSGFIPIGNAATPFSGELDGDWLGTTPSTIAGLVIHSSATDVGLFGRLSGQVFGIGLTNVSITGNSANFVGGLAASNDGVVSYSYVTGSVSGRGVVGSLVGRNFGGGLINASYTSGSVSSSVVNSTVGGLVGLNDVGGSIVQSYTRVSATDTGSLSGVGGFVGWNNGSIAQAYSTGAVSGVFVEGGFYGANNGIITSSYWDTQTSGLGTNGFTFGGSTNDVTGKTTAQLTSGLPVGFNSSIWGISAGINNGYPYLLPVFGAFTGTVLQPSPGSATPNAAPIRPNSPDTYSTGPTSDLRARLPLSVAGTTPAVNSDQSYAAFASFVADSLLANLPKNPATALLWDAVNTALVDTLTLLMPAGISEAERQAALNEMTAMVTTRLTQKTIGPVAGGFVTDAATSVGVDLLAGTTADIVGMIAAKYTTDTFLVEFLKAGTKLAIMDGYEAATGGPSPVTVIKVALKNTMEIGEATKGLVLDKISYYASSVQYFESLIDQTSALADRARAAGDTARKDRLLSAEIDARNALMQLKAEHPVLDTLSNMSVSGTADTLRSWLPSF